MLMTYRHIVILCWRHSIHLAAAISLYSTKHGLLPHDTRRHDRVRQNATTGFARYWRNTIIYRRALYNDRRSNDWARSLYAIIYIITRRWDDTIRTCRCAFSMTRSYRQYSNGTHGIFPFSLFTRHASLLIRYLSTPYRALMQYISGLHHYQTNKCLNLVPPTSFKSHQMPSKLMMMTIYWLFLIIYMWYNISIELHEYCQFIMR
jgi:hypothetical protein